MAFAHPPTLAVAAGLLVLAAAKPARAIVSGTVAPASRYAVALCEGESPSECRLTCGATLIAPNLLLTSRHCADAAALESLDCKSYRFSGDLKPAGRLWATAAAPVASDATFHRGVRWDVPRASACGHDLAVLTLETSFSIDEARPAGVDLASEAVVARMGTTLEVCGYGRTSAEGVADGQRRAIATRVLCAGGVDACNTVPGGTGLLPSEFVVQAEVCPGDSGAGVFDASGTVFGALARSIGGTLTCGFGVYTGLATHALLLARVARSAAALAAYPPPSWATDERLSNRSGEAPRSFGAPCDGDADCAAGLCRTDDVGLRWTCARPCADACGGACRDTTDGAFCFQTERAAPVDEGCRIGHAPDDRASPGVFAVLALSSLALRRTRRAT